MGARVDSGAHWLATTWSLAVEEQFYLVVPLLRGLFPGPHAFVNIPWRSDSLLSGAVLAVLVRWHPLVSFMREKRHVLLVIFVVLLLGAAALSYRPIPFGVFNHCWLAALYATFILLAFLGGAPYLGAILGSPLLVWFGKLSYGIYMFHEPMSGLLHGLIRHQAPELRTLSDAGITLLALGLTLALSVLSFRYFESPMLRLGHRFKYLPDQG